MIAPTDNHRREPSLKIDFIDPAIQNATASKAVLALLRNLTDRFQNLPGETTDLDWTAFRALAKAGAAEGIIRSTCTYADADGPCTEHFLVQGDYPAAMPSKPILTTEPFESVLVQARLTTTGMRWSEYLASENSQPAEEVRGFVLRLLWEAEPVTGLAQRVLDPAASEQVPSMSSENLGQSSPPEDVETDEASFGGPQTDPHDSRVVNWFSKRIYLGHDTQISRLFWLLAKKLGVPHDLGQVQRAVDRMETNREEQGEKEFQKAMARVRKTISKLRDRLREHKLDIHVMILKEGPSDSPSYTMIARFG